MRAFFISREVSAAELRYEKEGWKGKLHVHGVQSVTRTCLPHPLSLPPLNAIRRAAGLLAPLPPPSHPLPHPHHWIWGSFQQPRQKSRMASNLEVVSMIADIGQQQWSYTNFRLSDRTLRSRDRILEFSQELVKIYAAAYNFDFRVWHVWPVQAVGTIWERLRP